MLLNNLFNEDKKIIRKLNHRYLVWLTITLTIIFTCTYLIKIDNYYENIIIDKEKRLIIVEKEFINTIKNKKEIIIDGVINNYSINKIEKNNDIYLVSIIIKPDVLNIKENSYKILIGKESIIEYIVRIMKKIT